jgi:DNA mismatch repair protein MLH1
MDPANRTLDSMFTVHNPFQVAGFSETQEGDNRAKKRRALTAAGAADELSELEEEEKEGGGEGEYQEAKSLWTGGGDVLGNGKKIPESECEFTSIQDLRRLTRKRGNNGS